MMTTITYAKICKFFPTIGNPRAILEAAGVQPFRIDAFNRSFDLYDTRSVGNALLDYQERLQLELEREHKQEALAAIDETARFYRAQIIDGGGEYRAEL
jgi:hypothetical protein